MNAAVLVKVAFPEFEEAAERLEHLQAPLHRLAAQRIEHDIDALPAGDFAHGIRKGEVTRIEHMIGTGQAQERSLHLRAGCRDDHVRRDAWRIGLRQAPRRRQQRG